MVYYRVRTVSFIPDSCDIRQQTPFLSFILCNLISTPSSILSCHTFLSSTVLVLSRFTKDGLPKS